LTLDPLWHILTICALPTNPRAGLFVPVRFIHCSGEVND
jgi:hypothetical protein